VIGVCARTVGAVHDTVTSALPANAVTLVGAAGKNKSHRVSATLPPTGPSSA